MTSLFAESRRLHQGQQRPDPAGSPPSAQVNKFSGAGRFYILGEYSFLCFYCRVAGPTQQNYNSFTPNRIRITKFVLMYHRYPASCVTVIWQQNGCYCAAQREGAVQQMAVTDCRFCENPTQKSLPTCLRCLRNETLLNRRATLFIFRGRKLQQ